MKLRNILRTNWCATIGLNWKTGGMAYVLRMPIRVYGKLRWQMYGTISFTEPLHRNMLIIGSQHEDYTASAGRAELNIDGNLNIDGQVCIGPDAFIGVGGGAQLSIGQDTFIGRDSQIHCSDTILIGRDVFMGETYITDSTEHPIIKDGQRQPMLGTVVIGDGVYGGFRTQILRGAVIPPQSVIASGAVCTKDYIKMYKEKQEKEMYKETEQQNAPEPVTKLLLAGVPAIIKATNVSALKDF